MFEYRSQEKELIDLGPDHYTPQEYDECMRKLFKINQLLGFFRRTVRILKNYSEISSILDIGCGSGLFLINLAKQYPQMTMIGIDTNPKVIQIAQQLKGSQKNNQIHNVTFEVQQSPQLTLPQNTVDIILTTLVCHHLNDDELIVFLQHCLNASRKSVIIHDLQRHYLAYWFYSWLCPIFFPNRLLIHDGLISIKRGFVRADWQKILKQANIKNYQIRWHFPFCWSVILWKK